MPPTYLVISHVTAKSVVLGWIPGPVGGHVQTFSVRYRERDREFKLYKDGIKDTKDYNITVKVSTLLPETQYELLVTAHNVYGDTTTEAITMETRGILVRE